MSFNQFFDIQDSDFCTYVLKEEERESFVDSFLKYYQSCYICSDKLKGLTDKGINKKEVFESIFPTRGNIQSGDFGEILSNFIIEQIEVDSVGVKKWRWKESKDSPVHKIDLVLTGIENIDKPSPSDKLILGEVKAKATDLKYSQVKNAIDDIKKENVARVARTIIWAREKYILDGEVELVKRLDRFIKSTEEAYGEYETKLYAVGVIDKEFVESDLLTGKESIENRGDINLFVVSINKLKETYQDIYKALHNV